MPLPVVWLGVARQEAEDAVDWYQERSASAATRFVDKLAELEAELSVFPRVGGLIEAPFRHVPVKGFPYFLVYLIEGGRVHVLACAHHSRRPQYWLFDERLG